MRLKSSTFVGTTLGPIRDFRRLKLPVGGGHNLRVLVESLNNLSNLLINTNIYIYTHRLIYRIKNIYH